jgi:hypothetical protein
MPKIISHFEMSRTLTWVVVNDDGTVTMRIESSRASKRKTVSAAEAMHRWPTLTREIETAVREICGESAPMLGGACDV